MAARLRKELQADVEMVRGRYGELKVYVDGKLAVAAPLAFMGVLPAQTKVIEQVRAALALSPTPL